FEEDLIDGLMISWECVEEDAKRLPLQSFSAYSESRYRFVSSAWEELRHWPCFQDRSAQVPTQARRSDYHSSLASHAKKQKKPGRNDPCFCGSGKKYKKCCLNRSR
ncbi:MAG: SEC-C metal-binding domain-containing protein, partial [Mariprofundus sp.]|nr:SEC-C metal-binding domain-containing protein [Mariprofundus sp.]